MSEAATFKQINVNARADKFGGDRYAGRPGADNGDVGLQCRSGLRAPEVKKDGGGASKKHGESSRASLGFREDPSIDKHDVPLDEVLLPAHGNAPPEVVRSL